MQKRKIKKYVRYEVKWGTTATFTATGYSKYYKRLSYSDKYLKDHGHRPKNFEIYGLKQAKEHLTEICKSDNSLKCLSIVKITTIEEIIK